MLKDRLVAWSPVILLLLLVVLTWWLDARVSAPIMEFGATSQNDPEFYIEGFMAVRMNPDGSRRYELSGVRLTHYPDKRGSRLDSPRLLYHDYERAPLTVSADTAGGGGGGENVYFHGNVTVAPPVFASNPPLGLATSFLHVIPDKEIAKTDQPVTMTEGNSTARSVGLEFDNIAGKLRLLSSVQAHYDTPRSRSAKSQNETH